MVKEGEEEKMNIGHICDLEAMFDEEVLNNIMEEHKVKNQYLPVYFHIYIHHIFISLVYFT